MRSSLCQTRSASNETRPDSNAIGRQSLQGTRDAFMPRKKHDIADAPVDLVIEVECGRQSEDLIHQSTQGGWGLDRAMWFRASRRSFSPSAQGGWGRRQHPPPSSLPKTASTRSRRHPARVQCRDIGRAGHRSVNVTRRLPSPSSEQSFPIRGFNLSPLNSAERVQTAS